MSYGSLPGRRPKGTFKRAAATNEKAMKKTMVNGVVIQSEVKRAKLSTDVWGTLEDLSIGNNNMEEDLVDGFLFQSFSEAWDFSSMQPLCNFEVLSLLDKQCECYNIPTSRRTSLKGSASLQLLQIQVNFHMH